MEFTNKQKRAIIFTIFIILLLLIMFLVAIIMVINNNIHTNSNVDVTTRIFFNTRDYRTL